MKNKVIHYGKILFNNELISGSLFVFIGFFASSILNFILNLFWVRTFSASDYGVYASLLSLFILLGIPSQSLTTIIVRFATDYFAREKIEEARAFYFKSLAFSAIIFILVFFVFVVFSFLIKDFLHLDNVWYVILTGFIISFGYLSIVNNAFLQSLLKFKFISLVSVIGGGVRVLSGIILVLLGIKVFGALWAIFLSVSIPLLLGFIPLKFLIKNKDKKKIKFPTAEVVKYALPTSIAVISLNSLVSIDVILVKHFFNSYDAGLYGGLSLVGKVIFYFTGPITAVMFPLLIKRHNLGQNFNRLFYLALLLVTVPSLGIVLFFTLFPSFSINFFLGGKEYLKIAPYLGIYGLFIAMFSILNVCVNFFLSLKKTKVFIIMGFGAALQIILIYFYHGSFYQVIGASLLSAFSLLVMLLIYYIKEYGSFNEIKKIISMVNNPRM